jgi:hypothetical protein
MDAVAHFFQSIPVDLLIIQTVNGVVAGMILALVASGLTHCSARPSRSSPCGRCSGAIRSTRFSSPSAYR